MDIFLSYSYQDSFFCQQLTTALQEKGVATWQHDGYDAKSTQQIAIIQQQISACSAFVLLLSTSALASQEVRNEALWASNLSRRAGRPRVIPVVIEYLQESQLWPFLKDIKRIELAPLMPYSYQDALYYTLQGVLPLMGQPEPMMPPPVNMPPAQLLERSRTLLQQKRYQEALPLLQRLAQLAPYLPTTWYYQGVVFDRLGQYEQAVNAYEHALRLEPNMLHAWMRKGNSYQRLQRFEEALAAYERATAVTPMIAQAWARKGYLLEEMERFPEALDAYSQALALTPAAASANIWFNKGLVLQRLRRPQEALGAYAEALKLNPQDTEAAQRIATLQAHQRKQGKNERKKEPRQR